MEALEDLRGLAVAAYPHLAQDGRTALYRGLLRAAGLADPDDDGLPPPGATHDAEGRAILRGSEQVRAYLKAWGIAA